MTRYHINPTTGEPGKCVAKIRCRYGVAIDEHYSSKEEARSAYEATHSLPPAAFKKRTQHPATARALSSPLTYSGPLPPGFQEKSDFEYETFGTRPVVVDVMETPVGSAAVVWSKNSTDDSDITMWKRGFEINSISLMSMEDGRKLGYLKVQVVTEEKCKQAFGDDEWSAFRYKENFGGGLLVKSWDEKPEVGKTTDPTELLEAKQRLWHNCRTFHGRDLPPSKVKMKSWSYSEDDAPEGDLLEEELASMREVFGKQYQEFKRTRATPFVDFSRLETEVKGKGLGPALYVYTSRCLAKFEGNPLSSSGLQSEEAQGLWRKLQSNPALPVKETKDPWGKGEKRYLLDFTS